MEPLSPKQGLSIRESDSRINIWDGSVRSGKTVASILRWAAYCGDDAPKGDLLMVGKTERTLQRNILNPMADMFGSRDFWYSLGKGEARLFGRHIYLVGANNEAAQDKIRGMTLAGAYGDELTLWPESFFTMLLSRLSVRGAKGFYTTNPDSPFHWAKTDYLDRPELALSRFKFTLDDNIHLDPDYVAALKLEYQGLWFKRFILGLWVLAAGAIYDMFDSARHVVKEIPTAFDRQWVSVDYGTSNPTVFLLQGSRGPDYWTRREYYWNARARQRQKTDAEYSADMGTFFEDAGISREKVPVVVDPSAASFIAQLKTDGFKVRKAKNDVLDGIRTVSTLLGKDRYHIHESCKKTVEEKSAYIWDEKAQKKGEDKPVKENDHCSDAERYGLMYGATKKGPWTGRVNV